MPTYRMEMVPYVTRTPSLQKLQCCLRTDPTLKEIIRKVLWGRITKVLILKVTQSNFLYFCIYNSFNSFRQQC